MGIRYEPGMTLDEMCAMASVVKRFDGIVAAHVRGDAFQVFDAMEEFLEIGRRTGVKLQISHIGSMAAYGQMAQVLSYVDARAAEEGLDVRIDCYPYDAFCTSIGATTYDDGFLERYHDVTPVSYTHLDVDKRQDIVKVCCMLYVDWAEGRADLSATFHYARLVRLGFTEDVRFCFTPDVTEDVYKRQLLYCGFP